MTDDIESINEHLVLFTEDKQTPFSLIKIITSKDNTPFTVYVQNVSSYNLNNIKIILPSFIKQVTEKIPSELAPKEGFFLELEVDTSKSSSDSFKIEAQPYSISFE